MNEDPSETSNPFWKCAGSKPLIELPLRGLEKEKKKKY